MALPFKKAGGGFLNNVVGTIISIVFDLNLSGGEGEKAWRKLNGKLVVKVDGADEPVETYVDGGFIYDENITVDGAVIKGTDECPIRENSELAGLVGSMAENGLAESEIGAGLDYSFMSGLRVNFVKVVDEERNKRAGKRKDKNTGKEYNHELLRVSKVLGREDVKKLAAAVKGGSKTGQKAASKPQSAPAPAATDASSDDVDESATSAILAFIAKAKDGKVKAANLSGAFVKYALENNIGGDDRTPILNRMQDASFLEGLAKQGIITFDGKVISAAA